jgi:hypothetical protein
MSNKTANPDSASSGNPADVESIDAIITSSYKLISGPAGQKRDWARMRTLFLPGARLIPINKVAGVRDATGAIPDALDFDGYVARVSDYFDNNGFFETEVARRVEQYDRIAHAFSSYESRHDATDPRPFMRGINSFRLFNDGRRWWIVSIYWQQEFPDNPIPEKYLRSS